MVVIALDADAPMAKLCCESATALAVAAALWSSESKLGVGF